MFPEERLDSKGQPDTIGGMQFAKLDQVDTCAAAHYVRLLCPQHSGLKNLISH